MSFWTRVSTALFSFEGRMRRQDYWLATLGYGTAALISLLIIFGVALPGQVAFLSPNPLENASPVATVALWVLQIFSLWPTSALITKRRHDRGRSGKSAVAIYMAATAANFYTGYFAPQSVLLISSIITLLALAANLYLLVIVGLLEGERQANRFGPDPKDGEPLSGEIIIERPAPLERRRD